jgi:GT2 family glycosyltransferase
MASTHPNFEVVVVDQNEGDETEQSLAPWLCDPRLRYVRSATIGKSVAANIGLEVCQGQFVALTDDDCEATPQWLEVMEDVLRSNPAVGVAFCNVVAEPYDRAAGFTPDYSRRQDKLVKTLVDLCDAWGIGAGMAVRRDAVLAMGGFDPCLGPGGRFHACFDRDMSNRAVLMGYQVYETTRVHVWHFGFRNFREGRELSWRYAVGTGAAFAKPIKCGYWRFSLVVASEFVRMIQPLVVAALHRRRPRGAKRVIGFLQGFLKGLATPVDKRTLRFRDGKLPDTLA